MVLLSICNIRNIPSILSYYSKWRKRKEGRGTNRRREEERIRGDYIQTLLPL
jgi:hypothetical protein